MDLTFVSVGLQPGHHRGPGPRRRHLSPRYRRAHRPGRFRPADLRRHHAGDDAGGDRARQRRSEPGDIFIVNDPYLGGTHLMDVKFVKPFFYRGRLFAWLANTGHWPDIGGSVPGGYSARRHRDRAGGAAPAAGAALQGGQARRGDPRHHHVEYPRRGRAHRRHQGTGGGAGRGRAAPDRAYRPLRRRCRRGGDRRAAARARRGRCGRKSPRSPTASTRARPSSIPTASSTSRCASGCSITKTGGGPALSTCRARARRAAGR